MGMATIPMALLSVAGVICGAILLVTGGGAVVGTGLLACAAGILLAYLLEFVVTFLDSAALAVLTKFGRRAGRLVGLLSGILPMVVILGWEYFCLTHIMTSPGNRMLLWGWSYGVAIGPWTIFALGVGSDRRTMCSIRAYAGHIAYWLLSISLLVLHLPTPIALAVMALPTILPITVGTLLATADRAALRNVRI